MHCCNVLTLEAIERIVMCVHWQLNKLEWRSQRIKQLKAWNVFRRLSIWAIDGAFIVLPRSCGNSILLKSEIWHNEKGDKLYWYFYQKELTARFWIFLSSKVARNQIWNDDGSLPTFIGALLCGAPDCLFCWLSLKAYVGIDRSSIWLTLNVYTLIIIKGTLIHSFIR